VQRLAIDLLTVGANGAAQSPGIGTIAVRCARTAPTKVLLGPEHAGGKFDRVVAGADLSGLTRGVLEQALRLTRLRENVDRRRVERDGVDAQHDLIERAEYGRGIVRSAQETSADLFVRGTTGRSALGYVPPGTTAEKVLREVGCSGLTVKLPDIPPRPATELEARSA
jgi:hypothetical protein